MPVFKIYDEHSLGFTHCGEVIAEGEGEVELTDEEVQQLIDLIRENDGETDVEELELEDVYPEIYETLDDACRHAAYEAEYHHWIVEGYENQYYDISTSEAIDKCKEYYGFVFEFDKEKFLEENPDYEEDEIDDDVIAEAEEEAFDQWVEEYRSTLNDHDEALFLAEVFELDPNIQDVDYEVVIPEGIVAMVEKQL